MIVVLGATGTIGGEVLRQLVAQDVPVRALVRSPEREAALSVPAPTVVADLADPATLGPALDGADAVFLATPASPHQVELESALVDAVAAAPGRPHLVKLAALGYDAVPVDRAITLAGNHQRVVQRVRDAGVPHTVVAPSGFMSNLLRQADAVRGEGVLRASSGDGGLAWVDPADVAAVAVRALVSSGHDGASYDVTGPESLDHAAVARALSEATGRPVRYVDVPPEDFRRGMEAAGVPPWMAAALTELEQTYRAHLAEVVTDGVQRVAGRPPTPLRDWLARHRDAFAAAG
jgi:uncharacterized protein YbjT (DUF2867 family)